MTYAPEIEKMIARVQKRRECSHADAVTYMLTVATGRLAALWRYDDTLPEGKTSKGVRVAGKRKAAERTPPVGAKEKAREARKVAREQAAAFKPKKGPAPKAKPAPTAN